MRRTVSPESVLKAVTALLAAAVAAVLMVSLGRIGTGSGDEGKKRLETSIRRSAVACYADEGVYPPDIEYLKQHYGLTVDESRYIVKYSAFAENLMPDITVLEISDGTK